MINPVEHIDDVGVSEVDTWTYAEGEHKVTISDETRRKYEKALNPSVPFRQRWREFLSAENDLGKAARVIKHGLILFTPFGKTIESVTDFGKQILLPESQQNRTIMDKPKLKSKSIQGVLGIVITLILQVIGVDVTGDPELMSDIYHILYGLSGFWSVFGLRDALGKIIVKQEE